MFLVKVHVTLKEGVLDPQGKTVQNSLNSLGYDFVQNVRIGKYMELKIDGIKESEVRGKMDEACQKLLANPVIENYRLEIEECKGT